MPDRLLFVTGKLAEPALRRVLEGLSREAGFTYEVAVLNISVAALLQTNWVSRKLNVADRFDRAILPGWCLGELEPLSEQFQIPFERGPKDLYDLPEHFGKQLREPPRLDEYDIEIVAEINHAPQLQDDEILAIAEGYRERGADVIDVGCVPGESWSRAGDVVRMLRDAGHRVSIDSFDRDEVEAAVAAGAEMVLSVNGGNREWAADLDAELIVIPDTPADLDSLGATLNRLDQANAQYRIDPIIEPIGFGFAASLARYFEARRRWPRAEMFMGTGNLTELTDVDSAGLNLMLAAICQELGIRGVLTTEVIGWARTSVKELDIARRLVYHSVTKNTLPKHVCDELILLRDAHVPVRGERELESLAGRISDPNFRIFVERGEIHVMNRDGYWRGVEPFALFRQVLADSPLTDVSHAFYLGYEFAKAVTALTLDKKYTQDEALRWGYLTVPERNHRE